MKLQKKYKMNVQLAESTLQNVFCACNVKSNTASIKKLQEKQQREAVYYRIILFCIFNVIIFILLSPFYFRSFPAKISELESTSSTLKVSQYHMQNGIFYITFDGDNINYNEITLSDSKSNQLQLLSYNEETATISFLYTDEELNLFVPQKNGKVLHLLLSPKNSLNETRNK